MARGKGVNPITGVARSLNQGEIDDIKGLKAEAQATLKHLTDNPDSASNSGIDKSKLKREIDRYDAIIDAGKPHEARGRHRDELITEAKTLREKMEVNMPTVAEMNHPAQNPGAIQKHLKWLGRNDGNVRRYKEIMRQVEPDDPTATNIDRFRREK